MKKNKKYDGIFKIIFYSLVFVVFILSIQLIYDGTSLPRTYEECRRSEYEELNDLFCVHKTYSLHNTFNCLFHNGYMIGPSKLVRCEVAYYNPSFTFPTSLQNCKNVTYSSTSEYCSLEFRLDRGVYDKDVSRKLFNKCQQLSTDVNLNASTTVRYPITLCGLRFDEK